MCSSVLHSYLATCSNLWSCSILPCKFEVKLERDECRDIVHTACHSAWCKFKFSGTALSCDAASEKSAQSLRQNHDNRQVVYLTKAMRMICLL